MENVYRTIVNIKPFPFNFDYSTPSLFLGSCFTENIGNKLAERKFPVRVNPFGVVYNPVSVEIVLRRIISGHPYSENDLACHNQLWFSFDHHTSFSNTNKQDCLNAINLSLSESHQFWEKAHYLIITLGTARVYNQIKLNKPVANCHKIPAKEFTDAMLTVEEIVENWTKLITHILTQKPELKIVFTVSPVRHWKDGAIGNQISKSTLLLAVAELVKFFPSNVFYFPAYEIMMDDLRDYRFYADDMLHPSPLAINYIWEKFAEAAITDDAQKLAGEIEKILLALNHRPFNKNTGQYQKFVEQTLQKIESITQKNKGINFSQEVNALKMSLQ